MNRPQFSIILILFLGLSTAAFGQHVGVGTLDPEHRLDVRSSLDTTLSIINFGRPSVSTFAADRLGILNVMESVSGGSRTGILTQVNFPFETDGASDIYTGHQIEFNGICNPPSNCNPSDIFGVKVNIPIESTTGSQYGIYSDVQRDGSYAGYFLGRGYFSRDVGVGILPTGNERFYSFTSQHNRAARFTAGPASTSSAVEGIYVNTVGNSTNDNYGGRFFVIGNDGDAYGIHSTVNAQGTNYAGYFSNWSTLGPSRYGILAEVTGNASTSTAYGVLARVTGSTGIRPAYGIRSVVEEGAANSQSYGIQAVNENTGPSHYAGYFNGKVRLVDGEDASYATDGFLQIGTFADNVLFDNNEILARSSGESAALYIQNDGGDLLLCGAENGAVAIGINSPLNIPSGYLLAVDGKGIFEELRVEVSTLWPDYVFAKDYQMRTPSELKTYINTHGHLPGIPSADEVQNEGLDSSVICSVG